MILGQAVSVGEPTGAKSTIPRPPVAFTKEQRQDLAHLNVVREQIDRLSTVIGLGGAFFHKPAKMQDVRDRMTAFNAVLKEAATQVSSVMDGKQVAAVEVRSLVAAAAMSGPIAEEVEDREAFSRLSAALTVALRVVSRAKASVPKTQSRTTVGETGVLVSWIDHALMDGWCEHRRARGKPLLDPLADPSYPFAPSLGARSHFRKVVAVCYGAMRGEHECDVERVIRSYLKGRKHRGHQARSGRPELQVNVRFRRAGEQVWTTASGEPDLTYR